uniref:Uncharacterized protein n=1 Tax=Trypanosoma vivax (strain Y486) TaxID=1055687 RepID=G0U182_TRYVY|nr:hypothetical protein TVY486_0804450 [Trypanosoma vivax Y486]
MCVCVCVGVLCHPPCWLPFCFTKLYAFRRVVKVHGRREVCSFETGNVTSHATVLDTFSFGGTWYPLDESMNFHHTLLSLKHADAHASHAYYILLSLFLHSVLCHQFMPWFHLYIYKYSMFFFFFLYFEVQ